MKADRIYSSIDILMRMAALRNTAHCMKMQQIAARQPKPVLDKLRRQVKQHLKAVDGN